MESFDDVGLLIPRFFINMIFQFFYFLLRILTLVYFTPTHLLICLSLSKFIIVLIHQKDQIKYLSIIPFLVQFFSLMIYLEIIELNFCSLNRNTKRNIQQRVEEEMVLQERQSTFEEVEVSGGYYITNKTINDPRFTTMASIEMATTPDTQDKIMSTKI